MFDRTTHILVIDDDKEEFLILQGILDGLPAETRAFYELEFASSIPMAMERLAEDRWDLFIVDFKLGAANGIDFILETQAAGIAVPALLVTGEDTLDLPEEAKLQLELGMLRFLHKAELSWQTLSASVRELVPQRLLVLLVDDDEDSLVMLRHNLQDMGLIQFSVEQVSSLEAARSVLASQQVDIVILDYMLPGERGGELVPDILAVSKPPFVLVCSNSELAEKDPAFAELVGRGHAAFFPKSRFAERDLSKFLLGASRLARLVERRFRLQDSTGGEEGKKRP